jgi:ABC-2 type transport system ATP-binding protein/lipopolysaccharide transport system ATP-binding protein
MDTEETGYENIITCGLFRGMTLADIRARQREIAEFTELGEFLSLPLRTYSLGMQMRLAFAIATSGNPEILLLDEIIGAGDEEFAAKARERMQVLMRRASIIILASHAAKLIETYCNKALWLEAGRIVAFGPVNDVLSRYHDANAAVETRTR